MALVVENPPANAGTSSVPVLGRFPGGGRGHPLQYSCLETNTDRRAWWATVHRVAELHMTLWLNNTQHIAFNDTNFSLSTAFTVFHEFWPVVFLFSFGSFCLFFPEICSLIHVLFGSVLFNLQVWGIFQLFFCYWSIVLNGLKVYIVWLFILLHLWSSVFYGPKCCLPWQMLHVKLKRIK